MKYVFTSVMGTLHPGWGGFVLGKKLRHDCPFNNGSDYSKLFSCNI